MITKLIFYFLQVKFSFLIDESHELLFNMKNKKPIRIEIFV